MTTEEKIMTLHPAGKKGVNISKAKYSQVKSYILNIIKDHGEITYSELDRLAYRDLAPQFDGKVGWYIVTVKLDLEARGIISRKKVLGSHALELT